MARHGQQKFEGPIILALELSSMCGSLALVANNACICEFSLVSSQTHSKRLIPQIDRIMTDSGITWPQIAAIAVSLGPGSFTGLRITLSTVKGLALAFSKPLIGIPTLDALASQASNVAMVICPIIDARKQEVYTAMYRCDSEGIPHRESQYMAVTPEKLCEKIAEKTLFIGDGVTIYGEYLKENLENKAVLSSPLLNFTRAASIGMLAFDNLRKNIILDPASSVPLYVRASDAEINFPKPFATP